MLCLLPSSDEGDGLCRGTVMLTDLNRCADCVCQKYKNLAMVPAVPPPPRLLRMCSNIKLLNNNILNTHILVITKIQLIWQTLYDGTVKKCYHNVPERLLIQKMIYNE